MVHGTAVENVVCRSVGSLCNSVPVIRSMVPTQRDDCCASTPASAGPETYRKPQDPLKFGASRINQSGTIESLSNLR